MIRRSLSSKLSVRILLLAIPLFLLSLGILFTQSRHIIRVESVGSAASVLSAAMQRISRNVSTVETATNACSWLVAENLHPDSLLALSHRVVSLNPHTDGCSISTEPDIFPQYGRYFSAYSVREGDTIGTVIEEQYEYFEKVWYRQPRDTHEPCWVVYYDETDSLALTIDGLIASYSKPIYDATGRFIAVISTDLSLLRLSKLITAEEKPYPHSYFVLLDNEGHYFIHPDSKRLFTRTIFDEADPRTQADIYALGHEMIAGSQGHMSVVIDGAPCLVTYMPVPGTSWSLALVSPDSDILDGYHQLTYVIIPLLVIGILLILVLSYHAVGHAVRPLNELLVKTQAIAQGNMEVHIPRSKNVDAVGRLQNSFSRMLQSLNFHMGSVRYTSDQTKQRNEELAAATLMAKEAEKQKTTFIQNVSHQIRTPLNIIMGFAQVLRDSHQPGASLSDAELTGITDTMSRNSKLLTRLVLMLFDSSETGQHEELTAASRLTMVSCNEVAREAIGYVGQYYPDLHVSFLTDAADDFCIKTSQLYLMRSLREILYNAAKYSDGQHVSLRIQLLDTTVRFVVEDKGTGIADADREPMFKFFAKVDDLSEGLGLGLPLAKRHAQNLGGDLFLDETYHEGCRFIVEIPR